VTRIEASVTAALVAPTRKRVPGQSAADPLPSLLFL